MKKIYVLSNHKNIWRNFKCMLLSEGSNSEKTNTVWFQLPVILEKAKLWQQ